MTTGSARSMPHYWPDARQLQLLRASLQPERALELWPQISAWLDPGTLPSATARLLPQLGHSLRAAGIDDARLDEIDELTASTEARNRHLFEHVAELIDALESRGVQTMVLKGAALAVTTYAAIGLRPMGDLDLLVPTVSAEEAMVLTREKGWTPRHVPTSALRRWSPEVHTAASDGCQLDFHWHVFHDFTSDEDDADLWAAALPLDLAGASSRRLSPSDELLHVCVHGLRWVRTPGVRWVADAALIIQREPIDWARVVRQVRRRRFTLRARMALGYLRRNMDAAIPDDVLQSLRNGRVTSLERLEYVATSREHGTLRRLPQLVCHYERGASRDDTQGICGFGGYLADAWGMPAPIDLPRAARDRIWRYWVKRDGAP